MGRNKTQSLEEMTRACLEGKVAPEVLHAPKTGGDPRSNGQWPDIYSRSIGYIMRNVVGKPWADHLVLVAGVLSAQRYDPSTVKNCLYSVNARLTDFFQEKQVRSLDEWDAEECMIAYLKGELLPKDTQGVRDRFCSYYLTCVKQVNAWLHTLPPVEKALYQRFLLPPIHPLSVEGLTKRRQVIQQSQQTRKEETGAVVIQFSDLRAEGHYRYNRIVRLRQAYLDAVKEIHHLLAQGETGIFPFAFSYDEGSDPEHGVPAQERLSFRVWNRRSFVLAHRESYKTGAYYYYKNRYYEKHPSRPPVGETQFLLEFVKAERLNDDAPPESLWFLELFERDVMGGHPLSGSDEEIAAKKQWFQAWGYLDEDQDGEIGPFDAHTPGVLNWSREDGTDHFVRQARKKTGSLFLPIEALYAAATFGVLSVDVFTTTGMRMNEILQLRLTPDCFVRLQMPAPPGAKDQSPRIRYAFRLLPKGEKTETLHDYFIGEETKRLLVKVARTLAEHYNLRTGEALPTVAYSPNYSREHRFEAAPYLLQYNRQALPGEAITACLRFLLHGMIFRTRDAKPVILKAHLLRHAFATFAVQVEKIPLDIVGALLKQKNLDVTDYYSQPTDSMVAEAHDLYLARSALHLNVGEALRRSPEELQKLYKEAEGKAGTLADVIGGQCVCHGFCAAKFACVGCAGKVPDPAKRSQLERHRAWAVQQVEYATQEGLFPEAERMRQVVRDCDTELREIDQIEAYRRDEGHAAIIQIEPRKRR
jgi:hypothetical protein